GAGKHTADAAQRGEGQDLRERRGSNEAVILALDVPAHDTFASPVGELAGDGHTPADDIVGDVEQAQDRTQVVRAKAQGSRAGRAVCVQIELAAVDKARVDPGSTPVLALSEQVCR